MIIEKKNKMNKKRSLIIRVCISILIVFLMIFLLFLYLRYTPVSKEESFNNAITADQILETKHIKKGETIELGQINFNISAIYKISYNEYYLDINYNKELFATLNDEYSLFFANDNTLITHFSNKIKNKKLYMISDIELTEELDFNQLIIVKTGRNSAVELVIEL